jgi:hypothetical protein
MTAAQAETGAVELGGGPPDALYDNPFADREPGGRFRHRDVVREPLEDRPGAWQPLISEEAEPPAPCLNGLVAAIRADMTKQYGAAILPRASSIFG